MGWARQETEPLLLGMVRGQLWQGDVAGTPGCPSTAQRGQAGSTVGLQEATKASLEGALRASRVVSHLLGTEVSISPHTLFSILPQAPCWVPQ